MRRFVLPVLLAVLICGAASAGEKLVVGVSSFPHREIMEIAAPLLEAEGFALELREYTDYVRPNMDLADGELFANYFQHIPYLTDMNRKEGLGLKWIAKVHIEPLGLYSRKIKNLDELKDGDTITIPDDSTNESRALQLLSANGLITLRSGVLATVRDISGNLRNLKFVRINPEELTASLDSAAASVINFNFAGDAGLSLAEDAIIAEGGESLYVNVLVIREEDVGTPAAEALEKAVNSPEVRDYILENLVSRGIVPAF